MRVVNPPLTMVVAKVQSEPEQIPTFKKKDTTSHDG